MSDDEISAFCREVMMVKLSEILGSPDRVDILAQLTWHLICQESTTEQIVANELQSFLGDRNIEFVQWIISEVGPYISKSRPIPSNFVPGEYLARLRAAEPMPSKSSLTHTNHGSTNNNTAGNGNRNAGANAPPSDSHSNSQYSNRRPRAQRQGAGSSNVLIDPNTGMAVKLVPMQYNTPQKIKKRCAQFPNCSKGDRCEYIHPEVTCNAWPCCSHGSACFYLHPEVPCKFGLNCTRSDCNYTHPPGWDPSSSNSRYNAYTGTYKNMTYTPSDI